MNRLGHIMPEGERTQLEASLNDELICSLTQPSESRGALLAPPASTVAIPHMFAAAHAIGTITQDVGTETQQGAETLCLRLYEEAATAAIEEDRCREEAFALGVQLFHALAAAPAASASSSGTSSSKSTKH